MRIVGLDRERSVVTAPDTRTANAGTILPLRVPVAPADSPCQTDISLVLYLLGIPSTDSLASLRLQFLSPTSLKIAQFLCNLSSLESALIQVFILKNLNSFRMNTYEKTRGWGYPGCGSSFAALAESAPLCSM
jgi:hypothetical protein